MHPCAVVEAVCSDVSACEACKTVLEHACDRMVKSGDHRQVLLFSGMECHPHRHTIASVRYLVKDSVTLFEDAYTLIKMFLCNPAGIHCGMHYELLYWDSSLYGMIITPFAVDGSQLQSYSIFTQLPNCSNELLQALSTFMISPLQKSNLFSVLTAVYSLSNVSFTPTGLDSCVASSTSQSYLSTATRELNCPSLLQLLFPSAIDDLLPVTADYAERTLQLFAQSLYLHSVTWLFSIVNGMLNTHRLLDFKTISLVHVPRFRCNSTFADFESNLVFEKLLSVFTNLTLKLPQELRVSEHMFGEPVEFVDPNTSISTMECILSRLCESDLMVSYDALFKENNLPLLRRVYSKSMSLFSASSSGPPKVLVPSRTSLGPSVEASMRRHRQTMSPGRSKGLSRRVSRMDSGEFRSPSRTERSMESRTQSVEFGVGIRHSMAVEVIYDAKEFFGIASTKAHILSCVQLVSELSGYRVLSVLPGEPLRWFERASRFWSSMSTSFMFTLMDIHESDQEQSRWNLPALKQVQSNGFKLSMRFETFLAKVSESRRSSIDPRDLIAGILEEGLELVNGKGFAIGSQRVFLRQPVADFSAWDKFPSSKYLAKMRWKRVRALVLCGGRLLHLWKRHKALEAWRKVFGSWMVYKFTFGGALERIRKKSLIVHLQASFQAWQFSFRVRRYKTSVAHIFHWYRAQLARRSVLLESHLIDWEQQSRFRDYKEEAIVCAKPKPAGDKVIVDWINSVLQSRVVDVVGFQEDMSNGVVLCQLLYKLGYKITVIEEDSRDESLQARMNIHTALTHLCGMGVVYAQGITVEELWDNDEGFIMLLEGLRECVLGCGEKPCIKAESLVAPEKAQEISVSIEGFDPYDPPSTLVSGAPESRSLPPLVGFPEDAMAMQHLVWRHSVKEWKVLRSIQSGRTDHFARLRMRYLTTLSQYTDVFSSIEYLFHCTSQYQHYSQLLYRLKAGGSDSDFFASSSVTGLETLGLKRGVIGHHVISETVSQRTNACLNRPRDIYLTAEYSTEGSIGQVAICDLFAEIPSGFDPTGAGLLRVTRKGPELEEDSTEVRVCTRSGTGLSKVGVVDASELDSALQDGWKILFNTLADDKALLSSGVYIAVKYNVLPRIKERLGLSSSSRLDHMSVDVAMQRLCVRIVTFLIECLYSFNSVLMVEVLAVVQELAQMPYYISNTALDLLGEELCEVSQLYPAHLSSRAKAAQIDLMLLATFKCILIHRSSQMSPHVLYKLAFQLVSSPPGWSRRVAIKQIIESNFAAVLPRNETAKPNLMYRTLTNMSIDPFPLLQQLSPNSFWWLALGRAALNGSSVTRNEALKLLCDLSSGNKVNRFPRVVFREVFLKGWMTALRSGSLREAQAILEYVVHCSQHKLYQYELGIVLDILAKGLTYKKMPNDFKDEILEAFRIILFNRPAKLINVFSIFDLSSLPFDPLHRLTRALTSHKVTISHINSISKLLEGAVRWSESHKLFEQDSDASDDWWHCKLIRYSIVEELEDHSIDFDRVSMLLGDEDLAWVLHSYPSELEPSLVRSWIKEEEHSMYWDMLCFSGLRMDLAMRILATKPPFGKSLVIKSLLPYIAKRFATDNDLDNVTVVEAMKAILFYKKYNGPLNISGAIDSIRHCKLDNAPQDSDTGTEEGTVTKTRRFPTWKLKGMKILNRMSKSSVDMGTVSSVEDLSQHEATGKVSRYDLLEAGYASCLRSSFSVTKPIQDISVQKVLAVFSRMCMRSIGQYLNAALESTWSHDMDSISEDAPASDAHKVRYEHIELETSCVEVLRHAMRISCRSADLNSFKILLPMFSKLHMKYSLLLNDTPKSVIDLVISKEEYLESDIYYTLDAAFVSSPSTLFRATSLDPTLDQLKQDIIDYANKTLFQSFEREFARDLFLDVKDRVLLLRGDFQKVSVTNGKPVPYRFLLFNDVVIYGQSDAKKAKALHLARCELEDVTDGSSISKGNVYPEFSPLLVSHPTSTSMAVSL